MRGEPLILVTAVGAAIVFAVEAVLQHVRFESGHDLALFHQAVWHYSRFESPESTLANLVAGQSVHLPNVLADHFHPILATLAPLYWFWADARMLLVAQAALVAASAVPVFLFARLQVGRVAGYVIALAYLLYWGPHAGVTFDFHEVAFAPLLIALAIYFSAVSRWHACLVTLALLLLVKESFGLVVAFFGLYFVLVRRPKLGLAAIVGGIAWTALATEVLIPFFGEGHPYRYWTYGQLGPDLPHAVWSIVRDPTLPFIIATDEVQKVQTMFFLFAPFLGLALYSPRIVLALPLIAERMLAESPPMWGMSYHYSLAIAPVIAMASAEGLHNLLRFFRVGHRAVAVAIAGIMVLANIPKTHGYLLDELRERSSLRRTATERLALEAIARVPDHRSVAAKSALVPHLSPRSTIYELRSDTPLTDYVLYQHRGPSVTARFDPIAAQVLAGEIAVVADRTVRYATVYENAAFRILELENGREQAER